MSHVDFFGEKHSRNCKFTGTKAGRSMCDIFKKTRGARVAGAEGRGERDYKIREDMRSPIFKIFSVDIKTLVSTLFKRKNKTESLERFME